MKVMIVGSGGREHAVADSIARSSRVSKVYVAPGNAGMTDLAELINYSDFKDLYKVILDKHIDFVFIGPEQPLKDGLVDYLDDKGVPVIGPTRIAAQLETSKIFAKDIMHRYNIPTAEYRTFSEYETAADYLDSVSYPTVIKADGLAAGKGVIIANNNDEAISALQQIMLTKDFGSAGDRVVIEEFLSGFEASVFAFTDGRNFKTTIFSHDYKKILDDDKGLNTGGMGAFAPVDLTPEQIKMVDQLIFEPLLKGLKRECIEYKGVIYAGLIFTSEGIKVLEFNCRLGDPETQAVLPLLETDFMEIGEAIACNRVEQLQLRWKNLSSVSIVAASEGYPRKSESGKLITIDESIRHDDSLKLYFSNVTRQQDGQLQSAGGRVLTLTALAPSIPEAYAKAYANIEKIKFANIYYRRDIGIKR